MTDPNLNPAADIKSLTEAVSLLGNRIADVAQSAIASNSKVGQSIIQITGALKAEAKEAASLRDIITSVGKAYSWTGSHQLQDFLSRGLDKQMVRVKSLMAAMDRDGAAIMESIRRQQTANTDAIADAQKFIQAKTEALKAAEKKNDHILADSLEKRIAEEKETLEQLLVNDKTFNLQRQAIAQRAADELRGIEQHLADFRNRISKELAGQLWLLNRVLKPTFELFGKLNTDFKQANSSLTERNALADAGLRLMMETGESTENVGSAMKALIGYGLEADRNFAGTAKTVLQMASALDVSVEDAAQLAVTMKQIGVNLREPADNIARITDAIGLSSQMAAKLSVELGKSMQLFARASAAEFPKLQKELLVYAGALNQIGGDATDIAKLITSIQSGQNVSGAAMLGLGGDFNVTDPKQFQQVIKQLGAYSDALKGDSLQMRLVREQFAAILGTTVSQLTLAGDAYREYGKLLEKYGSVLANNVDLEKRYRNEITNTQKTWSMLVNIVTASFGMVAAPIIKDLNRVLSVVTDVLLGLSQFSGFFQSIFGMAAVGVVVYLGTAMGRAILATRSFIVTLDQLVTSMARARGISVAGGGGPGFGRAGIALSFAALALGLLGAKSEETSQSVDALGKTAQSARISWAEIFTGLAGLASVASLFAGTGAATWLKGALMGLAGAVSLVKVGVGAVATAIGLVVYSVARKAAEWLFGWKLQGGSLWNDFKKNMSDTGDFIRDIFYTLVYEVKYFMRVGFSQWFSTYMDSIKENFGIMVTMVKEFIIGLLPNWITKRINFAQTDDRAMRAWATDEKTTVIPKQTDKQPKAALPPGHEASAMTSKEMADMLAQIREEAAAANTLTKEAAERARSRETKEDLHRLLDNQGVPDAAPSYFMGA